MNIIFQETYDSTIEYKCVNGSQFDVDMDGAGDTVAITTRQDSYSLFQRNLNCHIKHHMSYKGGEMAVGGKGECSRKLDLLSWKCKFIMVS